jgi:hypothetical protein
MEAARLPETNERLPFVLAVFKDRHARGRFAHG